MAALWRDIMPPCIPMPIPGDEAVVLLDSGSAELQAAKSKTKVRARKIVRFM
jgi:hypothetical protein